MEREPAHGTRSPGASERCSTNSVEMLVRIPRAAPRPIAILAALMVREAVFFSFRAKVCCAKRTRVRAYHGVRQDVDAIARDTLEIAQKLIARRELVTLPFSCWGGDGQRRRLGVCQRTPRAGLACLQGMF